MPRLLIIISPANFVWANSTKLGTLSEIPADEPDVCWLAVAALPVA